MLWNVLTMTLISVVASFISIFINSHLLSATFISKKLKKCEELILFYIRYSIDLVYGVINGTNLLIMFFYYCGFQDTINSTRDLIFSIFWSGINLVTLRALLTFLINADRTLAVYLPIFYRNHRKKVGNFWIFFSLLGWLLINNMVLWLICDYQLSVPTSCFSFRCSTNQCYIDFWLHYEQMIYSLITFLSVIFIVKLYIWNNCSKSTSSAQKNQSMTRANRLAVIDTIILITFDLLPSSITPLLNFKFEVIGPYGSFGKAVGGMIEGIMVLIAMKRKFQVITDKNNKKSITTSIK